MKNEGTGAFPKEKIAIRSKTMHFWYFSGHFLSVRYFFDKNRYFTRIAAAQIPHLSLRQIEVGRGQKKVRNITDSFISSASSLFHARAHIIFAHDATGKSHIFFEIEFPLASANSSVA